MDDMIYVDGLEAVVSFDPDLAMFRAEFLSLSGGADCYATTLQELREEASTSLKVFREICVEKGVVASRAGTAR
jgi:predicted HicB family RNase H-like nuclease